MGRRELPPQPGQFDQVDVKLSIGCAVTAPTSGRLLQPTAGAVPTPAWPCHAGFQPAPGSEAGHGRSIGQEDSVGRDGGKDSGASSTSAAARMASLCCLLSRNCPKYRQGLSASFILLHVRVSQLFKADTERQQSNESSMPRPPS